MRTRGVERSYVAARNRKQHSLTDASKMIVRYRAKVMREHSTRASERHARNTVFPSRLQLNVAVRLSSRVGIECNSRALGA